MFDSVFTGLPSSFFFSGKILDDEKKVDEYKIEEKNFVVVMVTKVRYHQFHVVTHFW